MTICQLSLPVVYEKTKFCGSFKIALVMIVIWNGIRTRLRQKKTQTQHDKLSNVDEYLSKFPVDYKGTTLSKPYVNQYRKRLSSKPANENWNRCRLIIIFLFFDFLQNRGGWLKYKQKIKLESFAQSSPFSRRKFTLKFSLTYSLPLKSDTILQLYFTREKEKKIMKSVLNRNLVFYFRKMILK